MSSPEDRYTHSRRILSGRNAIEKQVGILAAYNIPVFKEQEHRYAKMHSLGCSNPQCKFCANPRKIYNELPISERKQSQRKFYIGD